MAFCVSDSEGTIKGASRAQGIHICTNRKWNFHLCCAGTELGKKLLSNLPFLATSQSIKTPPSALSPAQKDSLQSFYPCGFLKCSFGEEGLLRLLKYTLERQRVRYNVSSIQVSFT